MKAPKIFPIALFLLFLPLLQLQAQNWIARYETNGQSGPWQPVGLFVPGNGIMKLPPGNSPWGYFWTHFENNISICAGAQMVVEARVMNPASGGGIDAYDLSLNVIGNCGTAWVSLMGSGWAQLYNSAGRNHLVYGPTSVSNQPSLVQNLNTFGILRMEVNLTNITYRWNGSVIYTLPTPNGGIGETIQQIDVSFKGSGSVDYLKVWNWAGVLVYDEGFEDASFASASPCSLPPANCATPLPIGFVLFDAKNQASNTILQWNLEDVRNLRGFVVERSIDDSAFTHIGFVETIMGGHDYYFIDSFPAAHCFYRIGGLPEDGIIFYSSTLEAIHEPELSILRCLYSDATIQILIENDRSVPILLELMNLQGQCNFRKYYDGHGNCIRVPIELSAGLYYLKITSSSGDVILRRLIVQ